VAALPIFRSGEPVPGWGELHGFDIVDLSPGQDHRYERLAPREKLIVGRGACRVRVESEEHDATVGAQFDLSAPGVAFEAIEAREPTTLIRMAGTWGDDLGGSGLFGVRVSDDPHDRGDPVGYPKQTDFDAHFHDCDEYWIVFAGAGVAVTEGEHYDVGPGDCVATGMGHHHDFPTVSQPVQAVFFETTLEGQKRRGHLWEHTHGPAEPKPERV